MADVNIKKIINDLGVTDWGKDKESQLKATQLLKGISLSDEKIANDFMKALSDSSTSIAKKLLSGSKDDKAEDKNESKLVDRTNLILEGMENLAKPELKNTIQTKTINITTIISNISSILIPPTFYCFFYKLFLC